MAGTVTSLIALITPAEIGDDLDWESIGGGQGSGQDTNIKIQASASRTRRIDNAVAGHSLDTGISIGTFDLSALKTHLGMWVFVTQPTLCNAIDVRIGDNTSPTSSFDAFEVVNNNYPDIGGWLRFWVDISRVPDTVNNPDLSVLRHFGAEFDMGNVGGNAPNCGIDRIDYLDGGGISLMLDAGTTPSPATIADLVTDDEGTVANKYGVVLTKDGVAFFPARFGIGDATLTIFNDLGRTIIFADQPFAAKDWLGVTIDLQNASTDIDFADFTFQSGGSINLGDFIVLNTSGAFDADSCTWDTIRRIMFNSACTLVGGKISSSGQVDPTNGDYSGSMDLPGVDEYVDTQTGIDLNNTSGDFEIIEYINMTDWTPASAEAIASHYGGTIATESFRLQVVDSSGTILRLIVSDGSSETTLDSTVFSILPDDGHWRWVRVKYDQSAGQADFFWSQDPEDTPVGDISWTAQGTPTGTSRSMPVNSRAMLIGAENDGTPTAFMDGEVSYFEIWTDGFRETGAGEGDLRLRADWRTGADFTGSPATRADDFGSFTWEEQGTTPVYTQGDNNTLAADLDSVIFKNSTSESALVWNVNTDPNGELDNMSFTSSGSGHAIELGPNTPTAITLKTHAYSAYAGTDGNTGNEVVYNNSGKAITINSDVTFSVRNGTGASTTKVIAPKVTLIKVRDGRDQSNLQNARAIVRAKDGTGDLPFEDTVTITRSGSVATTAHTAHGLVTNNKVEIQGADQQEYNGVKTITVTGVNEYTYTVSGTPDTPATGTIISTGVVLEGLTDVNGEISDSRAWSSNQPVVGRISKTSDTPFFKDEDIDDVISSTTGLSITRALPIDE